MSLIVPVDLTAPSRGAVALAGILAGLTGEAVLLAHVSMRPPPLAQLAALDRLAGPLRRAGISARLRIFQGEIASRICQEASARACRWVIMGTRGSLEPVGSPGSVARQVLTDCPVAVAALRPGGPGLRQCAIRIPPSSRGHPLVAQMSRSLGRVLETRSPQNDSKLWLVAFHPPLSADLRSLIATPRHAVLLIAGEMC